MIIKGNRGFTLYEVLLVVFIIGVLSMYAVPQVIKERIRADRVATCENIKAIATYQTSVYTRCHQLTERSDGITRSGCDAGVRFRPPSSCGVPKKAWYHGEAPDYNADQLDASQYGYTIYFTENPTDDKIPIIVEAHKNLDGGEQVDRIQGTIDGYCYLVYNDVEGILTPPPDKTEINMTEYKIFNICAKDYYNK